MEGSVNSILLNSNNFPESKSQEIFSVRIAKPRTGK
jgi:hypothetical protein